MLFGLLKKFYSTDDFSFSQLSLSLVKLCSGLCLLCVRLSAHFFAVRQFGDENLLLTIHLFGCVAFRCSFAFRSFRESSFNMTRAGEGGGGGA